MRTEGPVHNKPQTGDGQANRVVQSTDENRRQVDRKVDEEIWQAERFRINVISKCSVAILNFVRQPYQFLHQTPLFRGHQIHKSECVKVKP
jgi:hypothetical protein